MKIHLLIALVVLLLFGQGAQADGSPIGRPKKSGDEPIACAPIRTNTFTPILDTPDKKSGTPGNFDAWPLTPELAKIGFIARRPDNTFLVIPNQLKAKDIGWVQLTRGTGSAERICASRIVAVFESEAESLEVKPLIDAIRSANGGAKFVRPLMQSVQIEWSIPFIGILHRFDPGPTFSLGGVVLVWDLDAKNTAILERFITNAPAVNLPGVLMMKEQYTNLSISISLTLNGDRLMKSRQKVSTEK